MGKKRALARLCEVFSQEAMLDMCRKVMLKDADITLVQQRFYQEQSRELCDMPVGIQRRRVPIIETYIVNEVLRRKDELSEFQRNKIRDALSCDM